MMAGNVTVQLRTKNFLDFSHQAKLSIPTSSTKEIYDKSKELFNEMYKNGTQVRLVGIRVGNLSDTGKGQVSLFENTITNEKQEKVDKTIDMLKEKFGYESIARAGNLNANKILNKN
jgi:DNA polymerase-4